MIIVYLPRPAYPKLSSCLVIEMLCVQFQFFGVQNKFVSRRSSASKDFRFSAILVLGKLVDWYVACFAPSMTINNYNFEPRTRTRTRTELLLFF